MKKQLTLLALALVTLLGTAATTRAQQSEISAQSGVNEFRIGHISSTEEATKFGIWFAETGLKKPQLRIFNEKGEELYNEPITDGYKVFKVLTEEPSGKLTFAVYDGNKRLTARTWQISAVNETKITAAESR